MKREAEHPTGDFHTPSPSENHVPGALRCFQHMLVRAFRESMRQDNLIVAKKFVVLQLNLWL